MSTITYQERMAALGIERGALETGFPVEDGTCTQATREPKIYSRHIGPRIESAPAPEDLTHLNPSRSAKGGRPRKETTA